MNSNFSLTPCAPIGALSPSPKGEGRRAINFVLFPSLARRGVPMKIGTGWSLLKTPSVHYWYASPPW